MRIYTLNEILNTEHIGDERYVRYEVMERVRGDFLKYGIHHHNCGLFDNPSQKKCTCGYEQALKEN